jgi:hypothetical protein
MMQRCRIVSVELLQSACLQAKRKESDLTALSGFSSSNITAHRIGSSNTYTLRNCITV